MLSDYLFYRAISPASGDGEGSGGIKKTSYVFTITTHSYTDTEALPLIPGEVSEGEPFIATVKIENEGVTFSGDTVFMPMTFGAGDVVMHGWHTIAYDIGSGFAWAVAGTPQEIDGVEYFVCQYTPIRGGA